MEPAAPSPTSLLPPRGSRAAGPSWAGPAGTADLPSAVPVPLPAPLSAPLSAKRVEARAGLLAALRQSIEQIERPMLAAPVTCAAAHGKALPWTLGCEAFDARFPNGLDGAGVHEVKPFPLHGKAGASAGDWMAGLGFALRLGVRRLRQMDESGKRGGFILWCATRSFAAEFGRLSWHGLAALGLDPARVLIVAARREAEALAALEDGLRSGSAALALGVFNEIELSPARRLSLAAAAGRTPCLAVTHPAGASAAATATRFQIARERSAPHPFDLRAPGAARFRIALARCRARPANANRPPVILEWSDETQAFRMAPGVADRAACPGGAGRSTEA